MRTPMILLLVLAVGFVGYVVYDQVTKHAAPEPTAEEGEDAAPTSGRRPDGDGIELPPGDDDAPITPRGRAEPEPETRERDRWLDQLRNGTDSERFDAAKRLGEMEAAEAVPDLAELLATHRDFYVRLGAAQALGRIGGPAAADALAAALLDKDELVRTAASEALMAVTGHRIRGYAPDDPAPKRVAWREAWEEWLAENPLQDK
ncbi:MAG: HEAT repeat domain-containing protein [Planctomycetota bacterium]|nr:HEAT repeat domain-containing protein [Planctomycetota bacterium]